MPKSFYINVCFLQRSGSFYSSVSNVFAYIASTPTSLAATNCPLNKFQFSNKHGVQNVRIINLSKKSSGATGEIPYRYRIQRSDRWLFKEEPISKNTRNLRAGTEWSMDVGLRHSAARASATRQVFRLAPARISHAGESRRRTGAPCGAPAGYLSIATLQDTVGIGWTFVA
ncbi:hypothetical protein EVAR_96208_1 [Eumeta japonica]|uniref:Uncharacterized protein n=1 Tax=Eumeta variegata TaxID=151549 RepID=A0A4C1T833_EUMVA|nr:hypothetical protein EVAR_96208_1 [Eumeta japonica]